MTLSSINKTMAAPPEYKSEALIIERFFAKHALGLSLADCAVFLTENLPERFKIGRTTIYNWTSGYSHMNEGLLWSLKTCYQEDDPRYQLALEIESMRAKRKPKHTRRISQ